MYHYVARTTKRFVTHQGGTYVSLCCSYNKTFCNTRRWNICITMLLVQYIMFFNTPRWDICITMLLVQQNVLEHTKVDHMYHHVARTTYKQNYVFVTHQGGSYVLLCCSCNRKICNTPTWIICSTMLLVPQKVL